MEVAAMVLQVLLGLAFLGAGAAALVGVEQQAKEFERFGYPRWFRVATGAVEVAGAAGMLLGVLYPALAALAGMLLAAAMAGAVLTHVRVEDTARRMVPAASYLVLALAVVALRLPSLGGAV